MASNSSLLSHTEVGLLLEKSTAFLMCDIQENFRHVMHSFDNVLEVAGKAPGAYYTGNLLNLGKTPGSFLHRDNTGKNRNFLHLEKLTKLAELMDIPLIVTEQYPKGLGNTVKEIDVSNAYGVYTKTQFSMITPEVDFALNNSCIEKLECVVLFGIEAHVCVEQTAAVLRSKGLQVHILADASTSRGQEDRLLAFERMRQIGCFISTFEAVLFKLLGTKDHRCFKSIKPLLSKTSPNTGLLNCLI